MTVRTPLSSFDFLQFVQKLWGVLSSPAISPTEHILGHDTAFCDITRGFGERPNQGGKAWVSSSMKTCGVHVSSGACCHKAKGELNSRLDLLLTLLSWFYNLWEKKTVLPSTQMQRSILTGGLFDPTLPYVPKMWDLSFYMVKIMVIYQVSSFRSWQHLGAVTEWQTVKNQMWVLKRDLYWKDTVLNVSCT